MKQILGVGLLLAFSAFAQASLGQPSKDDPWKPFQFMTGEWVGEGTGAPGEGSGGFSLQFDLERNVLVRKNYAEYPAQGGRAATRHEDLMIIYLDEPSRRPRAIYFDTEGHVIRYAISAAGGGLVFESEAGEAGPRYRLSYTPGGERIKGKFEMSAPGESQYKTYLDFAVRRKP